MRHTALLFLSLTVTTPLIAAKDVNSDGVVSLLVPIAFSSTLQTLPGAYGTRWTAEIWYHNGSASDIQSLQPTGTCMPNCAIGYPAGGTGLLVGTESNRNNGAMLHVPSAAAGGITMSARLLELSRQSQPTGVEIPVIPEEQFFTGEQWLLAVPSNSDVRSALRVYDPRARPDTEILVDFVGEDGAVLASTTLIPTEDPRLVGQRTATGQPLAPSVAASLDVTGEFQVLQGHERFHVRVRPKQQGREYWAMVSVTHNATQHVLLITSRP